MSGISYASLFRKLAFFCWIIWLIKPFLGAFGVDSLTFMVDIAAFPVFFMYVLTNPRKILDLIYKMPINTVLVVFLFTFWKGLSITWLISNDPKVVFLHWAQIFMNIMIMYCLMVWGKQEQILRYSLAGILVAISIMMLYLMTNPMMIQDRSNLIQPNMAAYLASIAGFTSFYLILYEKQRINLKRCYIALALLSTLVIILSASKTSLLGYIPGLILLIFFSPLPASKKTMVFGGGLLLLAILMPFVFDRFYSYFDRGDYENLSGRTEMWDLCMYMVSVRPWTGWGFESFLGANIDFLKLPYNQAHNEWYNTAAELGWTGVGFTVLSYGLFAVQFIKHFRKPQAKLCLAMFIYLILRTLSEAAGFMPHLEILMTYWLMMPANSLEPKEDETLKQNRRPWRRSASALPAEPACETVQIK